MNNDPVVLQITDEWKKRHDVILSAVAQVELVALIHGLMKAAIASSTIKETNT